MAYELVVTRKAEADLDAIIGYIMNELCNADAASEMLDAVGASYDALEDNPHLYPVCVQPILYRCGYRKIVIKRYLLIYRVNEAQKTVFVERFFSELQDYAEKV